MNSVAIAPFRIGLAQPLTIIAGPCQLESADHAIMIAEQMQEICANAGAQYVFKASYDKANRTSVSTPRGPGLKAGLEALAEVKRRVGCPVLTDVHRPDDCSTVAEVADILQIPAFLCRQTDLLLAAGETGTAVNVKKGQFLAPDDIIPVVEKIESTGNRKILLTERGSSFGYHTLVADMRALPQMAATGYPVIMDATHSVQQPGGLGHASGGQRKFAPVMARAAVAVGVAAVFIETHQDPDNAPSDGANMIPLDEMAPLIQTLIAIDKITKVNLLSLKESLHDT